MRANRQPFASKLLATSTLALTISFGGAMFGNGVQASTSGTQLLAQNWMWAAANLDVSAGLNGIAGQRTAQAQQEKAYESSDDEADEESAQG